MASAYKPELCARICDAISEGASLKTICAAPKMPSRRTVRGWLEEHPDFEASYERARRQRTDALVDEIVEIADAVAGSDSPAAVNAARLQVDTRRWLASKLLPERFGDKLQAELTGANGEPLLKDPPTPERVAHALLCLLHTKPAAAIEGEEHPAGEGLATSEPGRLHPAIELQRPRAPRKGV
jgi:hypothetical protein